MASRRKILVFLSFVLLVVVIMGTIMYVVEGPANGFTNVPVSVYWAISTMTTVGFGDITPKTGAGPIHRLGDDADRLGHARGADRHRQRRVHRAALRRRSRRRRSRLRALRHARPRAGRTLLRTIAAPPLPAALTPGRRQPAHGSRASAILRSFRCKALPMTSIRPPRQHSAARPGRRRDRRGLRREDGQRTRGRRRQGPRRGGAAAGRGRRGHGDSRSRSAWSPSCPAGSRPRASPRCARACRASC